MTPLKTAFLAASASLAFAATAALAAPLGETSPQTVRPADPRGETAIQDILRAEGYGQPAIAALAETARHVSPQSGRTYLTFEQRVLGTPVHASYVRAVIEPDGTLSQVVHRIADLADRGAMLPPGLMNEGQLRALVGQPFGLPAAHVKSREAGAVVFEKGADYHTEPVAQRVFVADEDGTLTAASLVQAWTKEGNRLVHTLVSDQGRVLDREERTSNDSYVAYKFSPGRGNATVMQGSLANRTASPEGWLHSGSQNSLHIRGNNVHAYADTNGDDAPDGGGRTITNGVFGTTANLGDAPTTTRNKEAAVQNLFYQINTIHDRLYKHGFTETAGNFQDDNYGRKFGGSGDHVLAEVLDGSGTNNANIAVPTNDGTYQGQGPRMQMYRWTYANPDRASSLDADIVWHEYGHGVLWRMVGDLDWPISWALNEGFADALAIVATSEDRVGEWASGRSQGIRSARYANTTKRLSSYTTGGRNKAHSNGEIYAAAIWAVREEFKADGRSDDELLGLMIEGLANTPPRATFLDMRDGMIAAGGSASDCRVWRGFARVGMGQNAQMSWSGTKSSPSISVRESSSVPSACQTQSSPAPAPAPPAGPQVGVYYGLQNVATGKYLDTDGGGGIDLDSRAPAGTYRDRMWRFEPVGDGSYWIVAKKDNRLLDSQSNNGVRWESRDPAKKMYQDKRWKVKVLSSGAIRLEPVKSGRRYLEAAGGDVRWNTGAENNASAWRLKAN